MKSAHAQGIDEARERWKRAEDHVTGAGKGTPLPKRSPRGDRARREARKKVEVGPK